MKACNSCPFLKGTENLGAVDWLQDVMAGIKRQCLSHSCHKTDPKADGYVGHKVGKGSVCVGFLGMMKKTKFVCIDPDIIRRVIDGSFDFADVPTDDCFQSLGEFAVHHLKPHLNKGAS